jgi:hypothetical protein
VSHWEYEAGRKACEEEARIRKVATKYCEEQLTIMDGSLEAAMKRIGTERFEKLVQDVIDAMPRSCK